MPKSDVALTLRRVIKLLNHLPRSGTGKPATELLALLTQDGFEVSKRTVERDLEMLQSAFEEYIYCNDKSKPYGWRWQKDRVLDVHGMDVPEALSLAMIEDTLKPLLPAGVLNTLQPRFNQAHDMLRDMAPKSRSAAWAKKVRNVQPSMPMIAPKVAEDVLRVVQECLLEDEQIVTEYQGAGRTAAKSLTLNPLALVQRGAVSYLVAIADGYEDTRLFAVHRIQSAKRSYQSFKRPKEFDLDQYIGEGHLQFGDSQATGALVPFKARLADWLARILKETPLSSDQTLTQKGRDWLLTATVPDTRQLQWWVLSQGAALEVIAPKALRQRIGSALRDAAEAYSAG